MRYFSTLLIYISISVLSSVTFAAGSKDLAKTGEELCKDKATQSVLAIAKINNADAVVGAVKYNGLGKKSKFGKFTCEFTVDTSRDDKTKTFKFTAEFSPDNKWCQVIKVELVSIPQ